MTDDACRAFFGALAAEAGTPELGDDEAEAVLDLARVVAHTHERRFAPLAAYAVGLVLGAGDEPAARERAVREVLAAVERLAAPS